MGEYAAYLSPVPWLSSNLLQACRAEFPLLVDVEAPLLPDPGHLLKTVQHALDDANDFSAHHLRLRLARGHEAYTTGSEIHGQSPLHSASSTSASGEDYEEENVAAILRLTPGTSGSAHS
jgi:phosphatidylinositol glycan class S